MANAKLIEVLKDLEQEKLQIEMEIADKNAELGVVAEAIQNITKLVKEAPVKSPAASLVDEIDAMKPIGQMVEDILEISAKPLHLNDILSEIEVIRGKPVSRDSLNASLSRYRKKQGTDCKVQSLGDGKYKYRRTKDKRGMQKLFG